MRAPFDSEPSYAMCFPGSFVLPLLAKKHEKIDTYAIYHPSRSCS